jgi:hypothetical protein
MTGASQSPVLSARAPISKNTRRRRGETIISNQLR